ncbi:MAG: hypothetical protein SOZ00_03260 [Tidjanibacter sp.]|nr:hypothetical protein [Tidjanibacter sp.]
MKTEAQDRQSIIDIALQTSGDVSAALDLAIANDLNITDDLVLGATLSTVEVVNRGVVNRYNEKGITPATDISEEDSNNAPFGGIGYMGIELDFMVSE